MQHVLASKQTPDRYCSTALQQSSPLPPPRPPLPSRESSQARLPNLTMFRVLCIRETCSDVQEIRFSTVESVS